MPSLPLRHPIIPVFQNILGTLSMCDCTITYVPIVPMYDYNIVGFRNIFRLNLPRVGVAKVDEVFVHPPSPKLVQSSLSTFSKSKHFRTSARQLTASRCRQCSRSFSRKEMGGGNHSRLVVFCVHKC